MGQEHFIAGVLAVAVQVGPVAIGIPIIPASGGADGFVDLIAHSLRSGTFGGEGAAIKWPLMAVVLAGGRFVVAAAVVEATAMCEGTRGRKEGAGQREEQAGDGVLHGAFLYLKWARE
jgi:hypothetical protein